MKHLPTSLDKLAWQFFKEFARCEYCLKAVGLRDPKRHDPTADWSAFADQIRATIEEPDESLQPAIFYYLENPPKKQGLNDGKLVWIESEPDHRNKADLVLQLVRRVRNNLFHGGKFNGEWFAPQRSEELLRFGIQILRASVHAHALVREAYENSAA